MALRNDYTWHRRGTHRRTPSKYRPRANTPKTARRRDVVRSAPPLVDAIATLGHPARPRKRR